MKTYKETEAYLFSRLPMYQRQGEVAFKKDLHNIKELCWHIGLPQWQFKSIHIAGTNGKGSVSSMLSSILMESGLKVGLYTSPHLKNFTERIRVNGKEISQKKVVEFVEKNQILMDAIQPSFFEMTVAMAFDHFAKEKVDIAVIEVGLGGRLDSTNIINPELSVITNISLDHQAMLGNTIEEIAAEKAGIIKSHTPIIIGESHPQLMELFKKKADEMGAPITFADQHFYAETSKSDYQNQEFDITWKDTEEDGDGDTNFTLSLDLAGRYQAKNLVTTLQTIEALREDDWRITDAAIKKGLKRVKKNAHLTGRMQMIQEDPLIFCDTAHNVAGVEAVLAQIKEIPHKNLHIVWGMVSDKNHDKILEILPKEATYYFVKPDVPRGFDTELLQAKAKHFGLKGEIYPTVHDGMVALLLHTDKDDLGYVGGSTFVVAEAI